MSLLYDFIEKSIEVFMDDFFVFGETFHKYLHNLEQFHEMCEETNLVLNQEKCYLVVQEGIVLGHRVSNKGLEVDKAKIDVLEKLPPSTNVKVVRSFLGHAGFYRRFIEDFSHIPKTLYKLLQHDIYNFLSTGASYNSGR